MKYFPGRFGLTAKNHIFVTIFLVALTAAIFFLFTGIGFAQQTNQPPQKSESTDKFNSAPPPAGPDKAAPGNMPESGAAKAENSKPQNQVMPQGSPIPQGSPAPQGANPQSGQPGQSGNVPPPPGPGIPEAQTTSEKTADSGSPVLQILFILFAIAVSIFLGYFYFFSYKLNLRIQRLETLMEKLTPSPVSAGEPSLFSWQEALRGFDRGWMLFSPSLKINTPGIVGIECKNQDTSLSLSANIIYNTVNEMNQSVIFLSKTRGEDEIGKALLAVESGKNPDALDSSQKEELIGRFSIEMTKYETGLFIFRDYNIKPEDLYEQVTSIAAGYETGCILIEKTDVLEKAETPQLLSQLRLLSVKTHIPVVLIDDFAGMEPDKMSEAVSDNFIALLSVKQSDKTDEIMIKYHKFNGEKPAENLPLNKDTRKIG
ncbi:MAG: hypothetical protein LWY06_04525 [Firmicutes bacterium]|nr:hypothetical protein [Bacillota bacterium]